MNCKIEDMTEFRVVESQLNSLSVTSNQEKDLDNTNKSMLSAKEILKGKKMNLKDREKALNMVFLLDNLIPVGFHIVIYGAAGSGKTTVMLFLMRQLLLENDDDVEVYFLYLDGQITMAANYENYLEGEQIDDRFNIISDGKANELFYDLEKLIEESEDPSKIVIVLDTLKHLNRDILSKSSNAAMMHRIKRMTKKGATVISLHHTNKDGENYAGTAEIEQDSDAILKLVTTDGVEKNVKISTLEEGGRVRFFFKSRSFQFEKGDPTSVVMLDSLVNATMLEQQIRDRASIHIIKGILMYEGQLSKTELETFIKKDDGFNRSERDIKRILNQYKDIHWKIEKSGDRNHIHNYSAIDNVSKAIKKISDIIEKSPL